jgi:pimeloyl-ACP methyl ester carboxylesterase
LVLNCRRWGEPARECILCVHGVAQHGGVFTELSERLSAAGHFVVAVDLRGHGDSGRLPPWHTAAHVADLLETLDALEVERVSWIGHSFGGRLVAAAAAEAPSRARRLILLDPALEIPAEAALRGAEIERLDWSFASVEGAVNAVLSAEQVVAAPRATVAAYAADDLRKGPDGRLRFSFCPSAVVVAWSEMVLPAPPIVELPTLIVSPAISEFDGRAQVRRYSEQLGGLLTATTVPNGHNLLWESPAESAGAIEEFLSVS